MAEIRMNPNFEGEVMRIARRKLQRCAQDLVDFIKGVTLSSFRRTSVGHRVLGAGHPPHMMTNRLNQSVMWKWKDGDADTVQVGTPLRYGLVQEVGAPGPGVAAPLPKHGKYMAIPWSEEAWKFSMRGGSPKNFPKKMIVIPGRGQAKLLVEQVPNKTRGKNKGTGAMSVIHYILTTHATIRPHPWLRPSFDLMRDSFRETFSRETA